MVDFVKFLAYMPIELWRDDLLGKIIAVLLGAFYFTSVLSVIEFISGSG